MICIINFGSNKTPNIFSMVRSLGYQAIVVDGSQTTEIDFEKVEAFILSGAPVLLTKTNQEPYLTQIAFVKTTNRPVLGICFGHQLIGMLFGAEVYLGQAVRTNTFIRVLKEENLFKGLSNNPLLAEDHTEGITLPIGFDRLASSDTYEVEAMKHQSKNIFGVQFHPEVSGDNGHVLMRNFLNLSK